MSYGAIPLILWCSAVVLRTSRGVAIIAAALGILVAWSSPAVEMIEAGDVGVSLVGVLGVLGLALLGNWHASPGVAPWCGLVAVTTLGWAIQPSPWLVFLVLSLGVWAVVGRWHGLLWHAAFGLAEVIALTLSYPAWGDWLDDWWVRLSLTGIMPDVSPRQLVAFGLWLIVLPAAWVVSRIIRRFTAQPSTGLIVGSAVFLITARASWPDPRWERPCVGPAATVDWLSRRVARIGTAIRAASLPDARVLWEELPADPIWDGRPCFPIASNGPSSAGSTRKACSSMPTVLLAPAFWPAGQWQPGATPNWTDTPGDITSAVSSARPRRPAIASTGGRKRMRSRSRAVRELGAAIRSTDRIRIS